MKIIWMCREGFERECSLEISQWAESQKITGKIESLSGYGFFIPEQEELFWEKWNKRRWNQWIFLRSAWPVFQELELSDKDRAHPIAQALVVAEESYSEIIFEMPDTNDGKQVTGFSKRFLDPLKRVLTEYGIHEKEESVQIRLFLADLTKVYIGLTHARLQAPWAMGIPRLRFPAEAPSRSTLKLAEAFEVFLSEKEQKSWLREGMSAVDLGAAPGGWTWQFVSRGVKTFAIDNGPLKGVLWGHRLVEHLRVDGFKFVPEEPVDWLVCDMVEQPFKVTTLMVHWLTSGHTEMAIFNLKLPMKRRYEEVQKCLDFIRKKMPQCRLQARHLYHDREEITVFVRK